MENFKVKLGISARHVHVSQQDLEVLFGAGAQLHEIKPLVQPGQFASEERVDLVTAKGTIKNVRILGPVRKQSQIELAMTDSRKLGLDIPVRDSGDLAGTPGITLVGPNGSVELKEGVIAAGRHIHLDIPTAKEVGLKDKDHVKVVIGGVRGLIFDNVLVRVSENYAPEMHIDTDEGNAALIGTNDMVEVIKK